jgi:ABC-type transport system involved in multi-copper enzyme maturation permease subunit
MIWLPVVERELRVASRRRSTYRVRLLALLAVGLVFGWTVMGLRQSELVTNYQGQWLFTALAIPVALFSILIGVFSTSDCISVEKREGTLGLLFLTDLKGFDIIGGKLVASSLNAFYALIAVLPILGLPIMAGGVAIGQFAKLVLALLTVIIFSLSIGVFVSTYARDERQSAFYTLVLLGLATLVPFGPGCCVAAALAGSSWTQQIYWSSIALVWLVNVLFLFAASREAPRSWQEKAPSADRQRPSKPPYTRSEMKRLIALHPFTWLALRGEPKRKLAWLFVLAMVGLWFLAWLQSIMNAGSGVMFDPETVIPGVSMVNTFVKVWIAAEASRRFVEDRRGNAFEILLSTPMNTTHVLRGQWLALLEQFRGPILALAAAESLLGFFAARHQTGMSFWIYTAAILLVLDSIAVAWAGIFFGAVSKGRIRAIAMSVIVILSIPWLLSRLPSGAIFTPGMRGFHIAIVPQVILFRLIIHLIVDSIVIVKGRAYLHKNLRRLLSEGAPRRAE